LAHLLRTGSADRVGSCAEVVGGSGRPPFDGCNIVYAVNLTTGQVEDPVTVGPETIYQADTGGMALNSNNQILYALSMDAS
jgi:hypothetical protein